MTTPLSHAEESPQHLVEIEQRAVALLKERAPDKFIREEPVDPDVANELIGITGLPARPRGYIRHRAQDFVVEEVAKDGHVASIEPASDQPIALQPTDPTIYGELTKIGLGTIEAINHLASALAVPAKFIGYAGLKDARALTSQHISIRRAHLADVQARTFNQFFVKLTATGKGAYGIGHLGGNRFTIIVRTEEPLEASAMAATVDSVSTNGFPNFYGPQRFGPRYLNPRLGRLICRGEFVEAARAYLTEPGPFDVPIYTIIRAKAAENYGDWAAMRRQFDILPYLFRHERRLLAALTREPANIVRALASIEDQVRFWVYGYDSYLVNKVLSRGYAGEIDIPDPMPLPLNVDSPQDLCADLLEADGALQYATFIRQLPFIQNKFRTIKPWLMPEVHVVQTVPMGAILSFTLPRAAYATTFLTFLFRLYEGLPVPDWVRPDEIDSKEILGTGSAAAALAKLKFVDRYADTEQSPGEEKVGG